MTDTKNAVQSAETPIDGGVDNNTFHYASRGEVLNDANYAVDEITGFDDERKRARTYLTAEEEKKLLRRMDWHIMPFCAIMFLLKNIDSENVRKLALTDLLGLILNELGFQREDYE